MSGSDSLLLRCTHSFARIAAVALALCLALPAAADGLWSVPDPGACAPKGGLVSKPGSPPDDAAVAPFKTGDVFEMDRLGVLKRFLPDFMWPYRERFFFAGMRMEIGPCFADYSPPAFFEEATQKFRGAAGLNEEGGLTGYTAGLPFAPPDIALDDPQAGNKWLWNVEMRYQGAGFRGKFRITDLVGRTGRAEPFEGEIFQLQLAHRSDRSQDGYVAPGSKNRHFVSGGLFTRPFDAREYAWRQFRDLQQEAQPERSDELHVYIPGARRVRRINSARLEGLYMPSFSVGVQATTQLPGIGGGGIDSGGGGAGGSVGGIGGAIQTKRSGYEGLVWRPSWHSTRVVGLHDVLTPINSIKAAYPEQKDRNFGAWGLSWANDRWDLRRALVLELVAKGGHHGEQVARQLLYVDLQTLSPLYLATFDSKDELTNIGYFAGRWSEARKDYPRWPGDETKPVRVIDPVGAAFANLAEAGSWRRESWQNVSTPPKDRVVKRMVSVNQLTKRR